MTMRAPRSLPQETQTSTGGKWTPRPPAARLYQPLPKGQTKGTHTNLLLFLLFNIATWSLFNANGHPVLNDGILPNKEPFWTWYLKVGGHFVEIPGERFSKRIFVACPGMMNEYMKVLGLNPMFRSGHCAFCEAARNTWKLYDAAWEFARTFDNSPIRPRKEYSKDDVQLIHKLNPLLAQIRRRIDSLRMSERYVYSVFDLDKFGGVRELDDGESAPVQQVFMGAKGIYDTAYKLLNEQGIAFYDLEKPRPIRLTKDTNKGVQFAEYTVLPADPMVLPPDLKTFLEDDGNIPPLLTGNLGEDVDYVIVTEAQAEELLALHFPDFVGDDVAGAMRAANGGGGASPMAAAPSPPMAAPSPVPGPVPPPPRPLAPAVATAPAPAPAVSGSKKGRW